MAFGLDDLAGVAGGLGGAAGGFLGAGINLLTGGGAASETARAPAPQLDRAAYYYPSTDPEVLRLRERGQSSALRPGVQLDTYGVRQREGDQLAARQTQSDLIASLQAAAAGQGPSAAGAQLDLARQQAIADQMAMAGSARGGALARVAAQRGAQQQAANITSQAGYQSAILKAQEQQAARQQLGQAIEAQRARDLMAQGLSLEEAVAQSRLETEQNRLNQEREIGYLGAEQRAGEGIQGGAMRYQEQQAGLTMDQRRMQLQEEERARQARMGLVNAAIGASGAVMAQGLASQTKGVPTPAPAVQASIPAAAPPLPASSVASASGPSAGPGGGYAQQRSQWAPYTPPY